MTSAGAIAIDNTIGELELQALEVKSAKLNRVIDVEDKESLKSAGFIDANPEPVTSRWELWAWYAYYFGNNSAGTLSYAPLIFQSLLNQAGHNGYNPREDCSADVTAPCVVRFGVKDVNIDTVVLICNGLVFAFQGIILLCFGSMGDYGHWKKWILITATLTCWSMQFGFLGLKNPTQYQAAIGLYVVSSLSYNVCQAFWMPSFPQLARNTPEALESRRAFKSALGAAYGLHANESTAGNNKAAVVIIGVATGVWIVCGTPWFFLEKPRAAKLPKGETYFSVGAKAYWNAFKRIPRLTQTWLYLLGYFLISDGYATTNQIYTLCQNAIVSYSTTTSTELYIVQGLSNAIGIAIFWLIQRHWKVRTKVVLLVNCGFLLVMPIWGCIGIGTTKFAFHKIWEVWAFSVIDCAAVAPFYAFSATMLSDICPKGREVTFFALYALVSKSTAWIGPIISGVIIDRTGSTWKGFPFSLSLTLVGYICIGFVDVKKGKEQCERYVLEDPTLRSEE